MSQKGLTYVPLIKDTYAQLMAAQHSKLQIALRLGGHFNDAKEAVAGEGGKSGHGKWMTYCKTYFPEISHRTINVYMSLAEHRDKFSEEANSQRAAKLVGEGDLSIREAIDAVNKADGGGVKPVTSPRRRGGAAKPQDLAAVLSDKAPDELLLAIPEKEKKDELLKQQLRELNPYNVADLLQEVWVNDVHHLQKLGEVIAERLKLRSADFVKRRSARRSATASI
jgi:hypothetical protein